MNVKQKEQDNAKGDNVPRKFPLPFRALTSVPRGLAYKIFTRCKLKFTHVYLVCYVKDEAF